MNVKNMMLERTNIGSFLFLINRPSMGHYASTIVYKISSSFLSKRAGMDEHFRSEKTFFIIFVISFDKISYAWFNNNRV